MKLLHSISSRARLLALISLFLTSLILAACGDTATPVAPPKPTTPANSEAAKIVVLLSGPSNDGSWNALGFEAVSRLHKELGVTVDYAENVTTDKANAVMRDYATKGYGLIIAHGAEYGDNIKQVAPEFPNTWFVQFNGDIAGPNFASVSLKFEEATYLAGIVAAKTSSANKFGLVTGPKVGPEIAKMEGFRQGLQAVKPGAELSETFLNSWDDDEGAKVAAGRMYDNGTDLIYYSVNGLGVLKEAQARGKKVINQTYDLNYLAPTTVVTSVLISVPASFSVPASLWKEKKLEGKNYKVGLKEQALTLARFRGNLSKDDEATIEKAKAEIIAGNLKIVVKS